MPFGTCQNCHCELGVTVSGEVCNHIQFTIPDFLGIGHALDISRSHCKGSRFGSFSRAFAAAARGAGRTMCQSSFGFGVWATLHFVVGCKRCVVRRHVLWMRAEWIRTGLVLCSSRTSQLSTLQLQLALSKVSLVIGTTLSSARTFAHVKMQDTLLNSSSLFLEEGIILYPNFRYIEVYPWWLRQKLISCPN